MDPNQFVESLRKENKSALSRLYSAETPDEGRRTAEELLREVAGDAFHARETFEEWADSEGNETARDSYAATAEREGEHYGRLTQQLDGDHEPGDTPSLHDYLRSIEDTAGRAGAFVGRTVTLVESTDRLVGIFADSADASSADLFRNRGDEADAQLEAGRDLLLAVCETDDEWARAKETAGDAIQAATPSS